jgi:hypothetical protein
LIKSQVLYRLSYGLLGMARTIGGGSGRVNPSGPEARAANSG